MCVATLLCMHSNYSLLISTWRRELLVLYQGHAGQPVAGTGAGTGNESGSETGERSFSGLPFVHFYFFLAQATILVAMFFALVQLRGLAWLDTETPWSMLDLVVEDLPRRRPAAAAILPTTRKRQVAGKQRGVKAGVPQGTANTAGSRDGTARSESGTASGGIAGTKGHASRNQMGPTMVNLWKGGEAPDQPQSPSRPDVLCGQDVDETKLDDAALRIQLQLLRAENARLRGQRMKN